MHLKYLVNLGHDEPQDKLVAQVECSLVTNSSKSGIVILFSYTLGQRDGFIAWSNFPFGSTNRLRA